jgi:DNA repair protein RadD
MRDWQERTVPRIRDSVRQGHKRIVVQAATGAGKTLLAAHLFANSISKGKRPLFIVPDLSLIDQTIESFEKVGILDVGVIQGRHERTDHQAQVQIASVQTLLKRDIPEVDVVIVDECHVSYKALYALMNEPAWAEKIIIGMSATPWARGMGMHWTDLIIGATIAELIGNKVLCPFTVFGPGESIDRSKITVVNGEYDEGQSAAVMSSAKVTADVVETWKKRWGKDKTFMFCVNRAHAREQQAKFEAAGVPWGYIDGNMTIEERKPVFAAFRSGRIKGIASVGCLSRGVDEDVHYIIDAQPTKSEMNLVQKIGRGLRNPGGGDKRLLVADHAGNQGPMGLGLVDDIFHDELDSRLPKDKTPAYGGKEAKKPNMCPSCNAYIRYGTVKCSLCGAVLRVASKVAHVAGELSEYAKAPKKPKVPATQADKQEFLSGFLSIAANRGYTPGWAAHKYKERFGVWPRGLREVPAEPTKAVLDYEKYLRIRFIKSKGAASAK